MAGCQKNPGSGWLGVRQGGERAGSCLKCVAELGIFLFGDVRAANADTSTAPPEGREGGKEEEEVVFPLSATIASSELHERKNGAFRLH